MLKEYFGIPLFVLISMGGVLWCFIGVMFLHLRHRVNDKVMKGLWDYPQVGRRVLFVAILFWPLQETAVDWVSAKPRKYKEYYHD